MRHAELLALCRIKGIDWYLIAREALRPGGLERLLHNEFTERSTLTTEAKRQIAGARSQFDRLRDEAAREIESARADSIQLTTVLDDDYPLNLRTIFNLPPFLFYRGRLEANQDAFSVAVVGTRTPTPEGLTRAGKMARLLGERQITVLSGLAVGIDTRAHQAALQAGGRTVSVLGSGLRKIYPRENRALAEKIAESGALVSQFWPDSSPTHYSFPKRNVTMSGMGQGTVVIEASHTSGAKMQARLALEHGKKVFLIHNLVTSQSWARKYLSRNGAMEVYGVEDIFPHLDTPDRIRERTRQAHQLSLSL